MTTAAISAAPTTPPTTPPAIAPVSELLLEDVALEVLEGDGVRDTGTLVAGPIEPVDWTLVAVDSGLSERSDECPMQQLYKRQLTANRLSKRYVEHIACLEKNHQHSASRCTMQVVHTDKS